MKKISIICVVRNDNYGLHQADRTIGFLKSLNEIPNKDSYEIILVEWNPINGELGPGKKVFTNFKSCMTKFTPPPAVSVAPKPTYLFNGR